MKYLNNNNWSPSCIVFYHQEVSGSIQSKLNVTRRRKISNIIQLDICFSLILLPKHYFFVLNSTQLYTHDKKTENSTLTFLNISLEYSKIDFQLFVHTFTTFHKVLKSKIYAMHVVISVLYCCVRQWLLFYALLLNCLDDWHHLYYLLCALQYTTVHLQVP